MLLVVVMPLVTSSDALFPSSSLLLVVMPGATSTVLATSSDALVSTSEELLPAEGLLLSCKAKVGFISMKVKAVSHLA